MTPSSHFLRKIIFPVLIFVLFLSACVPDTLIEVPVTTIPPVLLTPVPAATHTPIPAPTTAPAGGFLLYQNRTEDGNTHLSLVDLEAGTHSVLAEGAANHEWPVWTPDGERIIYQRSQGVASEIHAMDWNGENDQKLSQGSNTFDSLPSVSPDGAKIAFISLKLGSWALFVMDVDGSNPFSIVENIGIQSIVSWSPDNTHILFTSVRADENLLLIAQISADGSGYAELTPRGEQGGEPQWSPDGARVVFTCMGENEKDYQICLMNADGSDRKMLTKKPGGNRQPVWSPDGTRIAFASWRDDVDPNNCFNTKNGCNTEIYLMDADGSNPTRLTNDAAEDWDPNWSPDGRRLAFNSLRNDIASTDQCGNTCNSEIYIMNADGTNLIRVTENTTPDWKPQWRPRKE